MRDPVVARWWKTPAPDEVEAEYGESIDGTDPTEVFVIVLDGVPVGIIQRYRITDDDDWVRTLEPSGADLHAAAGIDYLIGEASARGYGVGTAMVTRFSALTFSEWADTDRIVVAVQQANEPSWRALERAGYQRVWAGLVDSDDPSDSGPAFVLAIERP